MNRSSIKLVTDNDTQRSAEWTRGWFPGSCSHLDRMSLKTRRVVYSRGDIRRRRRRFSSRACVHAGAFSLASLAQRANTYINTVCINTFKRGEVLHLRRVYTRLLSRIDACACEGRSRRRGSRRHEEEEGRRKELHRGTK